MHVSEPLVDPGAVVIAFDGADVPSVAVETLIRSYAAHEMGLLRRFFSIFGGIEPGGVFVEEDDDDDVDVDVDPFDDEDRDEEPLLEGKVALDGVSLHVSGPGCVALVGPTGCGKSLLLRAIAGLTPPSHGRIVVRGTVAPAFGSLVRLFPRTGKVRAAVPVLASYVGMSPRRARRALPRISELLDDPDLGGRWNAQVAAVTRHHLVLATLLALDPQILLLDMPLPSGAVGERCRGLIRELKQSGGLVLVSGRSASDVEWIADRVVTMERGQLLRAETLHEALDREAAATAEDATAVP
jgi:ABC-type polysaccharide/polyol phosphate transport system ATPase subunit